MIDITNEVVTDGSPLVRLLGEYEKSFVGYVFGMRFDQAFVLTNDDFKHKVNGIPQNSFLVAAGFNPENFSAAKEIDKEVILLRVLEPMDLPEEDNYVRARIERHQRRTAQEKYPEGANDGHDAITAVELQAGALRCSVLGTFYLDKEHQLRLGSDIENFMTLSRMRAYKPRGKALEMIVNHVNPEIRKKAEEEAIKAGFPRAPSPIQIGTVRFTSTARIHRGDGEEVVLVYVQASDFLGRRTVLVGITRSGKSNSIKTIVSAVRLASIENETPVGQLIFDINGEYANANHQDDGSSIADVFGEDTIRYRAIETPGFEDLRTNFYRDCDQGLNLIQSLFKSDKSPFSGQDLDAFLSSTLEEPPTTEHAEHTRWQRHRAAFQCILYRAGYAVPDGLHIRVPRSARLLKQLQDWGDRQDPPVPVPVPVADLVTPPEACEWFEFIRSVNLALKDEQSERNVPQIGLQSSTRGSTWVDPTLEAYLNLLARETSRRQGFGGWRAVQKYREYHSSRRTQDVIDEVIANIHAGKIVILDLSVGPVEIRTVLSKRIAQQLFDRQMAIMNSGEMPPNVVLYVEEAHNLIGKKAELTDTWPRIAKEGGKARMAFVYATQEPSSLNQNILSNTENWFVTHLNNDDELRTVSKFYDFSQFSRSLKQAQDVGFARLKTLSEPFVIPAQIDRFSPESIKQKLQEILERKQKEKDGETEMPDGES